MSSTDKSAASADRGDGEPELPLLAALLPIIAVVVLLTANFQSMGMDSLDGPNQLVLIGAGLLTALIGRVYGRDWPAVQSAIVSAIASTIPAILIILIIGALIASWFIGGIVPTLIYFGLDIISPCFFYVTALVLCCATSLAVGSSWSTTATVGLALFGVSQGMGLPPGPSLGAIISGAYFGDKMSPFSDTTNLAAAATGTDLFRHIRYMRITTLPAIALAALAFLALGLTSTPASSVWQLDQVQAALLQTYNINPVLLLVPLITVGFIVARMPTLPALVLALLLGWISAIGFQFDVLVEITGAAQGLSAGYIGPLKALSMGFTLAVENSDYQRMFRAGGMAGMLPTIWLILSAMIFGGALEGAGVLRSITHYLLRAATTPGRLTACTAGASVFTNATAADHFLAIVVPARLVSPAYKKQGLASENLSRTLEDSGTVTSPLIPWNTCGAYQISVFSVDPLVFIPFCFFNLLSPLINLIVGFTGFRIALQGDMSDSGGRMAGVNHCYRE